MLPKCQSLQNVSTFNFLGGSDVHPGPWLLLAAFLIATCVMVLFYLFRKWFTAEEGKCWGMASRNHFLCSDSSSTSCRRWQVSMLQKHFEHMPSLLWNCRNYFTRLLDLKTLIFSTFWEHGQHVQGHILYYRYHLRNRRGGNLYLVLTSLPSLLQMTRIPQEPFRNQRHLHIPDVALDHLMWKPRQALMISNRSMDRMLSATLMGPMFFPAELRAMMPRALRVRKRYFLWIQILHPHQTLNLMVWNHQMLSLITSCFQDVNPWEVHWVLPQRMLCFSVILWLLTLGGELTPSLIELCAAWAISVCDRKVMSLFQLWRRGWTNSLIQLSYVSMLSCLRLCMSFWNQVFVLQSAGCSWLGKSHFKL